MLRNSLDQNHTKLLKNQIILFVTCHGKRVPSIRTYQESRRVYYHSANFHQKSRLKRKRGYENKNEIILVVFTDQISNSDELEFLRIFHLKE